MGRRSPKLEGKNKEVIALFEYLKQRSGMTLLKLEEKFTPHPNKSLENYECGNNYGGGRWSRWLAGKNLPEIGVVRKIYQYVCGQLVNGSWKENGNEKLWASLLPAVIEPKFSFLLEKRVTLLKILEQLEEPIVTKNMLQAISAGYYIPAEVEIRKIFWSKTDENVSEYAPDGYHIITCSDEDEQIEMEAFMADILGNFGIAKESSKAIEEFAMKCGFVGSDPSSWADQIQQGIQLDAQLLSDICLRMEHIYPRKLKWASDVFGNNVERSAAKKFNEMQDQLMIVNKRVKDYSELINNVSKEAIIVGLFQQLSNEHFKWNGYNYKKIIGFNYPTVFIM